MTKRVMGGNRVKDDEEENEEEKEREKKETEILYTGRDDRGGTIEATRIHTRMKEPPRRVCSKKSR